MPELPQDSLSPESPQKPRAQVCSGSRWEIEMPATDAGALGCIANTLNISVVAGELKVENSRLPWKQTYFLCAFLLVLCLPTLCYTKQLLRNTVSGDDYIRRQSTSSGHFNMYATCKHSFGNFALAVACPQHPCAQSRIGTEGRMKDASHPDGTIAQNTFATVTKPVIIYGSGGAVTPISTLH